MKSSAIALLLGMGLLCQAAYAETATAEPTTVNATQNSGSAFLEKNKNEPGVKTTADGLQYKVLVAGNGPKPTADDVVVVHYEGKLLNGKEFDSSYKRGEPATFPVSGLIKGWTEALQLMPVGSTWQLFIPANLAYGEQGAPPDIGPNETLVFKVQLISIKKG